MLSNRWLTLVPVAALIAVLLAFASATQPAAAHPLGNFTVNRYTRIEPYSDKIRLHYVLDMAEIPAFQEAGAIDTDGNGEVDPTENEAYAKAKSAELLSNTTLSVGGSQVEPSIVASDLTFPEGQGGLETLRLTFVAEAPISSSATGIEFADENYADRLGWREIVVSTDTGATTEGEAPTEDASQALTVYPDDLLSRPLDVSSVAFTADTSSATIAPTIDGISSESAANPRSSDRFASLINTEGRGIWVILGALGLALAFGALHALEPGHGKTIVGAYFVGERASVTQAALLGLTIAGTHTIGVLSIGLIVIYASSVILPEQLYPWLGLASGVMILALGLRLLLSHLPLGSIAHRLKLPHLHHHHHHDDPTATGTPWRTLFWLGLADGLTPSPSALVVLLGAVALGRLELGIALIVAFSVGLAAVLTGISIGLIGLRGLFDRAQNAGQRAGLYRPWMGQAGQALPAFAGAAVFVVGLALTIEAVSRHPAL